MTARFVTAAAVEAAMRNCRHLHVGLRTAHCSKCSASIERKEEPSSAEWFRRCLDFVTWHRHGEDGLPA
ncbi:MAG: hypothetical protein HY816_20125 [Candidatus Wallbacteria bacterium]|nr:hypothetical protein [Candidatus Wallbacteria bacterium]